MGTYWAGQGVGSFALHKHTLVAFSYTVGMMPPCMEMPQLYTRTPACCNRQTMVSLERSGGSPVFHT